MDSQIRAPDPGLVAQTLSIRHAKESCFRRMDDCTTQKNSKFTAKAQAVEQMLQLWAKHSGVDARKGMSLDDRLKDHVDLKTTIISLLELIEQKMAQALSSSDEQDDAETAPAMARDNFDVDPEEFLIKQKWRSYKGNAWETVGAAVDMLIELTAMIRKSTVRNSSLPTHFHRPDDYFVRYAKILARNWFKDARRSLIDQLGDSVFVRRRLILYKMKHEEKISYPAASVTPVPDEPKTAPLTIQKIRRQKQATPQMEFLTPTAPVIAASALAPSSTNLSQLNRDKLKQRRRKIEAPSGITEGSVSVEETTFSYMYPEPPTLSEKQRYGVCPYCSGFLSASKLTKEAWRKHLHEDLQPYVCISEKCRDPTRFFSNSAQWLQHMDRFHGRDWPQKVHMITWHCDMEHGRLEFKSESELQKHLSHDHESLSEAHVNALVRRNWGVGCREAHVCPLCESTPSNIVPSMSDKDKATLLFGHIGDHLKALALFSLPSLSTDPASYGRNSSSGAQIPTDDDSKADSAGNNHAVAQADEDLRGSLTFNDDPHHDMDTTEDFMVTDKERISDIPFNSNAALEWRFVISEQGASEVDPILENLRVAHDQSQQATISPHRRTTLLQQLLAASVESVFDYPPQSFFPNGIIDDLITKESITSELCAESSSQAWCEEQMADLAEFIFDSARKLFAITVLTRPSGQLLQKSMEDFRGKGITDRNLPLNEFESGRRKGRRGLTIVRGFGNRPENEGLWPPLRAKDFCLIQHRLLAPVFSTQGRSYDFQSGAIIPFTEKGSEIGDYEIDGFTKFKIHENHINQHTTNVGRPYYVAVQKADPKVATPWAYQADMFSRMNSLNHQHIVRFLDAFRKHGQDGYFIFEWPSGGSLRDLWHTFHRPELTSALVKAAFRQMVGLTSAIHNVHSALTGSYYGHGNLKPENIFWFKNGNDNELGMLKIAGWEFREEIKDMRHPWADQPKHEDGTEGAQRSLWHEAPELSNSKGLYGIRSRFSDLWSMGCIMLEFLIWLMYGVRGLNRFSQAMQPSMFSGAVPFYQTKREHHDDIPVVTVDPVVQKWMDHMAADPVCGVRTTALGSLLDLISTRLLVVKLPPEARLPATATPVSLQAPDAPHPWIAGQSRRCTSSELEERMRRISDEDKNESYWLRGEPNPPPRAEDSDLESTASDTYPFPIDID